MSEPKALLAPIAPKTVEPRLWAGGQFIKDGWRTIADDAPLPDDIAPILSLVRWRRERQVGRPVGVAIAPTDSLDPLADIIDRAALVALTFGKFTDGRAYSQAQRLRAAGYRGEVRATGDVLLDQLPLMLRAGFDSFEIRSEPTIAALAAGRFPAPRQTYQVPSTTDAYWLARRSAGSRT